MNFKLRNYKKILIPLLFIILLFPAPIPLILLPFLNSGNSNFFSRLFSGFYKFFYEEYPFLKWSYLSLVIGWVIYPFSNRKLYTFFLILLTFIWLLLWFVFPFLLA